MDNLADSLKLLANDLAIDTGIALHILIYKLVVVGIWVEYLGDIVNPGSIFGNGRVAYLETFLLRMKCNSNPYHLVFLSEYFAPQQCSHDSLLAVDENALPGR